MQRPEVCTCLGGSFGLCKQFIFIFAASSAPSRFSSSVFCSSPQVFPAPALVFRFQIPLPFESSAPEISASKCFRYKTFLAIRHSPFNVRLSFFSLLFFFSCHRCTWKKVCKKNFQTGLMVCMCVGECSFYFYSPNMQGRNYFWLKLFQFKSMRSLKFPFPP